MSSAHRISLHCSTQEKVEPVWLLRKGQVTTSPQVPKPNISNPLKPSSSCKSIVNTGRAVTAVEKVEQASDIKVAGASCSCVVGAACTGTGTAAEDLSELVLEL